MELNFATWQAAWATELACIAVELEKAMASKGIKGNVPVIHTITRRGRIRAIAADTRIRYAECLARPEVFGTRASETMACLDALDLNTCTRDAVDACFSGITVYTQVICDCCERDVEAVALLGEDREGMALCASCCHKALDSITDAETLDLEEDE